MVYIEGLLLCQIWKENRKRNMFGHCQEGKCPFYHSSFAYERSVHVVWVLRRWRLSFLSSLSFFVLNIMFPAINIYFVFHLLCFLMPLCWPFSRIKASSSILRKFVEQVERCCQTVSTAYMRAYPTRILYRVYSLKTFFFLFNTCRFGSTWPEDR